MRNAEKTKSGALKKAIVLALLMVSVAGLAYATKPRSYLAADKPRIDYEVVVPSSFGDWEEIRATGSVIANPQQDELLKSLYSQTVAKTFVHKPTGRRIMLSLAYGEDQSRQNQVHKPEVCYPAQGFQLTGTQKAVIETSVGEIPVMRLKARAGERHEPVVYWIRVGDTLVRGAIEQNIARLSFGLKGRIPDGLLFRISEINRDADESFELQDRFVADLMQAVSPENREALIGRKG
jgi:EpsI family protein